MKREPRVLNTLTDYIPDDSIFIGRPSKWGNPFSLIHHSREECIEKYKEWLDSRPDLKKDAKKELKGKDLVCFCSPLKCHGDILLEIANHKKEKKGKQ